MNESRERYQGQLKTLLTLLTRLIIVILLTIIMMSMHLMSEQCMGAIEHVIDAGNKEQSMYRINIDLIDSQYHRS